MENVSTKALKREDIKVGLRVESRLSGHGDVWYYGTVVSIPNEHYFEVLFDDAKLNGGRTVGYDFDSLTTWVRPIALRIEDLKVGDKVQYRCHDEQSWRDETVKYVGTMVMSEVKDSKKFVNLQDVHLVVQETIADGRLRLAPDVDAVPMITVPAEKFAALQLEFEASKKAALDKTSECASLRQAHEDTKRALNAQIEDYNRLFQARDNIKAGYEHQLARAIQAEADCATQRFRVQCATMERDAEKKRADINFDEYMHQKAAAASAVKERDNWKAQSAAFAADADRYQNRLREHAAASNKDLDELKAACAAGNAELEATKRDRQEQRTRADRLEKERDNWKAQAESLDKAFQSERVERFRLDKDYENYVAKNGPFAVALLRGMHASAEKDLVTAHKALEGANKELEAARNGAEATRKELGDVRKVMEAFDKSGAVKARKMTLVEGVQAVCDAASRVEAQLTERTRQFATAEAERKRYCEAYFKSDNHCLDVIKDLQDVIAERDVLTSKLECAKKDAAAYKGLADNCMTEVKDVKASLDAAKFNASGVSEGAVFHLTGYKSVCERDSMPTITLYATRFKGDRSPKSDLEITFGYDGGMNDALRCFAGTRTPTKEEFAEALKRAGGASALTFAERVVAELAK